MARATLTTSFGCARNTAAGNTSTLHAWVARTVAERRVLSIAAS
jgi:hypothetical protein